MRTINNDLKYVELLKNFRKAHSALVNFYLDETDGEYTHLSPAQYPFEQSLDDYVDGIRDWVFAQCEALKLDAANGAFPMRVEIEGGKPFDAYTTGGLWNGWQMPYFEFSTAMTLCAHLNKNGGTMASYDTDTDTFVMFHADSGDSETYKGQMLETVHGTKKVYAIGWGAWCWDNADDSPVMGGFDDNGNTI